jgi:cytosine/adenosine deaminase-related metal-dependent hydrolase
MNHYNIDLNILSKKLLTMATKNGAQGLRLNSGELAIGKDSDIIAIDSFEPNNLKTIYTDIILHTQKVSKTIINGNTTGTIIA